MQLNSVKAKRHSEVFHLLGIGMIHEHTYNCYKRWELFNDLGRPRRLDISGAALTEIQADGIGAKQSGVPRILEFSNTADFDARHRKPLMAAAGSGEVKRCSPIRKASAPASSSKSISFLV